MRRRKSNESNGCLMTVVIIIGIPVFLLMVHPLIFWLVFLPLAVTGIVNFIKWLKK